MPTDTDAVIVRIIATQKEYEKQMASIARSAERAAKAAEKSFATSQNRIATGSNNAMKVASTGFAGATQAAGQLSFQLNDIAVGMTGGMSPFTIMMQQGSQVVQVMQQVKAQGGSMGAVIASAFRMMINPIALVSFGLIALAGYAYKYFTEVEDGSSKAEKELKKHADALDRIGDKYRNLAPEAHATLTELKRIREIKEDIKEVEDAVDVLSSQSIQALTDGLAKLGQNVSEVELVKALGPTRAAEEVAKFRTEVEALIEKLRMGLDPSQELATVMAHIGALDTMAPAAGFGAWGTAIKNDVVPGLNEIIRQHQTIIELQKTIQNQAQLPMQNLAPPYATGNTTSTAFGQFTADKIAAANKELEKSYQLIRKFEGAFLETPKWDVDHLRMGWSSDTITDIYGNVTEVVAGMSTTVEAADRDLFRRIGESRKYLIGILGEQTMRAFNDEQKAVLDSLVYNYGKLPPSVAEAIRKGGSTGEIATAISQLTDNASRRKEEAQVFAGGAFDYEAPKEKKASFDELFAQNEKRIAQQIKINEIERDTTATVDEQKAAVEALRIEEELLDAAREQGIPITDALKTKIHDQAAAMAQLGLANAQAKNAIDDFNKKQKEQQGEIDRVAQQIAQMAGSAISGFINDLRNGVSAGEAFNNMINRIIDSLIDMMIQMLIVKPLMNAISSGLGGGIGAVGMAAGGTVGLSKHTDGRKFPAAMWAGAPRFQSGGVVGLRPGEVPIIAHKGEVVIPAIRRIGTSPSRGGDVHTTLGDVNIDMSQSGMVAADNDSAKMFGQNIQKLIHVEMVRESRPGGLLRRV